MTTCVNTPSASHALLANQPAPRPHTEDVGQHAMPHAGTPLARQAGASVDNFLAWMLLAVIVAAAVFGGYYVLNKDTENNQEAQNIAQLVKGAKLLRDMNGYGNVTTAALQAAGAIPSNMIGATTGTLYHSWNGEVTVVGAATQFVITYRAVPSSNCIPLRANLSRTSQFVTMTNCPTTGNVDLVLTAR
ncbi:type 4 pilus major pilin [Achromobacter seleniivolatilans]|uniref:Type 4 pilus major pilin n=1 Tax=Achromobacter seleniivolatilans TaxID=3047478 RepID=A0ABY9LY16_9BURK|nr:type 4 pilus major pilin [Achromobacter sp. R39]WMD19673.1 type 4 pilus major pilin [Achromobacter sp. R39]